MFTSPICISDYHLFIRIRIVLIVGHVKLPFRVAITIVKKKEGMIWLSVPHPILAEMAVWDNVISFKRHPLSKYEEQRNISLVCH